jgi:alkylhydroperoxidase family enzyme
MNAQHKQLYEAMRRAVLDTKGDAALDLRAAVAARAAALSDGEPGAEELPGPLGAYTDKVALHAYKVVDADIASLQSDGLSEDAIFELTLAAALGAAGSRYEKARDVLEHLD